MACILYYRSRIAKFVDMPAPNRRTKVVLLDEVEGMTEAALFALRKIMEENNNTAFILLCNEIRFLNSPILSRCIKFRFFSLSDKILLEMAKTFVEDFQLDLSDEVFFFFTTYLCNKLANTLYAFRGLTVLSLMCRAMYEK